MTTAPRLLFAFSIPILLAVVAPRLGPGPHAAVQSAPSTVRTSQPAPSPQQAYTLPPDKLAKAIALGHIRNILDIVGGLWGIVFLWLFLSMRGASGLQAWALRIARRRWLQGLIFFTAFLVILTLASLPVDAYAHSVSRSYGISIQGWAGWLGDQAKSLGLTLVFGVPVLLFFNFIVIRWPRRYWLGIWFASLPILVMILFISPLLEPIFDKFEPLSANHADLVAKLEEVVARTGTNIPPDRMFLMKASEKTNGLNAYVSGIGATKRIVVWDTTAGRIPDDEVMFVFGHESGHYVLNHIPKMISILSVALFFIYWACAVFADSLAHRYGARWLIINQVDGAPPLSTRAGFIVLIFAISVAGFVLEPASNTLSRHFEHEADVYGQEAIHGLVPDAQKTAIAGFNALGEAWLDDPDPRPFIEFWEYNHPSVKTRANFAAHYDPWANGGHGQFFDK
jgi:Zn-dependent protease with chaperone function